MGNRAPVGDGALVLGGGDVRTRDKAGLGAAGRGGRGAGAEEALDNKHAMRSAVKAAGGVSSCLPAGRCQILSDFGPAHLRLLRCILLLPLLLLHDDFVWKCCGACLVRWGVLCHESFLAPRMWHARTLCASGVRASVERECLDSKCLAAGDGTHRLLR